MLRFGTQYLYCPNEGCQAHTKEFRTPLVMENAISALSILEYAWVLKCPFCKCMLLRCDNCCGLILGDSKAKREVKVDNNTKGENKAKREEKEERGEVGIITCLECGFANVLVASIRKKLQLKPIFPLDYATVRFIQRCICGDEPQTALESSGTNNSESNASNSALIPVSPPNPTSNSTLNPNSNSNSNPASTNSNNNSSNSNSNPNPNSNINSNSNSNSSTHNQPTNSNSSTNNQSTNSDSKKRQLPTFNTPAKKLKFDAPPPTPASPAAQNKMREIARAETKTLESISFWNTCHKFSNSHLMMLQVLYQGNDSIYERIFSQATCFVKEHSDIVHVKLQCEAALKVWDRLKFSDTYTQSPPDNATKPNLASPDNKQKNDKNTANNNNNANNNKTNTNKNNNNYTSPIKNSDDKKDKKNVDDKPISVQQSKAIVASILWSRYDRLRRRLQYCTKPYILFLLDINTELMHLYADLQLLLIWQAENIPKPFLGDNNTRERFEKEEAMMGIINKIVLWRLFYKTISVCVL